MKILIVEDEAKTREYLRRGLSEEGWIAETAATGLEGLYLAQTGLYDAIILDVMLPELDGFSLLQKLREGQATPVMMLTARDKVDDRVRGLRGGADDYLVKPFSFLEVLARLDVIVRRYRPHQTTDLQIGDLYIDFVARRVTRGARRLALTAKEFALLEVLARRRSHIVSKTAIAALVWDINFDTNTNVVEVAVKRLRAKLELPGEDKLVHTVRGMGYMLEPRGGAVVE
jgi:two-component system copper resistance phosphate regulon response regulator CusR